MDTRYEKSEVNYSDVSTQRGRACAGCRWFHDGKCTLVKGDIMQTGICDQYTVKPVEVTPMPVMEVEEDEEKLEAYAPEFLNKSGSDTADAYLVTDDKGGKLPKRAGSKPDMINATQAPEGEPDEDEDEDEEEEETQENKPQGDDSPTAPMKPQAKKKPRKKALTEEGAIGRSVPTAVWEQLEREALTHGGAFKAIGQGVWIAAYSNNFRDREGEIITEKAHKDYVRRVAHGFVDMPELWFWHTKGTRFGQAKWLDYVGEHMIVAVGTFDDTPAGKSAERKIKQANPGTYSLSHGFTYPKWAKDESGVYHAYNTFEISVLPRGKEANIYTSFEGINDMPLNPEKKAHIEKLFGPEASPAILEQIDAIENAGKALADVGVQYKDFVELEDGHTHDHDHDHSHADKEATGAATLDGFDEFAGIVLDGQKANMDAVITVEKVMKGMADEIRNLRAEVKAQRDELNALLETPVSQASTSQATVTDNKEATEAIGQKSPRNVNNEEAEFWGLRS